MKLYVAPARHVAGRALRMIRCSQDAGSNDVSSYLAGLCSNIYE